ncbi:hypothetical protein PpBr36_02349 [Pyricularia pennisetigena]|uniref:hypothetical protein n=1 Tax=Pyricularia pennisetigena TaxID=1578925 RepID=UPI00114F6B6B|nr:hypothetical protein PpBr36_02349 [Pyricularia pennisetigena]TLS30212.1 hypothetical protein PpBr36_02349 [Pyricularia pennisetigena]
MAKDALVAIRGCQQNGQISRTFRGDAVTIHYSDAFCLKFLRRLDRGGLLLLSFPFFPTSSQSGHRKK